MCELQPITKSLQVSSLTNNELDAILNEIFRMVSQYPENKFEMSGVVIDDNFKSLLEIFGVSVEDSENGFYFNQILN